jgi:hypothetical protein
MRIFLLLVALAYTPGIGLAQGTSGDSSSSSLRAVRIPVSIGIRPRTDSTWGVKLRVTGSFLFRDVESLDDLRLDSFRNNAVLVGAELLIPFGSNITLLPRLDLGVGVEEETGETVFLVEAQALAEIIFPWQRFYFGVLPAIRMNGQSGNELGSEDDQLHGGLRLEARYPLPFTISRKGLFAGLYSEVGYFFNGLEFVSVSGSSSEAQQSIEVGITTGFYDVRPKIWFIRLPRVSVGYRFGSSVSGFRIQIGGDWATPISLPR